jgi:cytochrome c-type biogenesis protein CcmF
VLTAGSACLIIALASAVYGVAASLYGARTGRREWVASGRRAVYAMAGSLVIAFAILESAFLRSDFTFQVVSTHSSTTTPAFYRATALWSSQEGSLLLWATLLGVWSGLVLFFTRRRLREVAPYATAVLLGLGIFFVALLVFAESPFTRANPVPAEGNGLNPLLRHPSMMIHPPMLYSGYTLFAIPFAFAIGALIARRLDAEWIRNTRSFALAAWFFLGVGIILGSRWSYSELGWGGYWAWDPVENASLMPWLTGTAFLHSVMIQERRGMLKIWNVSLILATGILALLGTFLVRSGILDSIHAFGASTLGVPFLVLIGALIVLSVVLVSMRAGELRSDARLDSLLSREAVFLLNNLVLVGLCFVVLWGTFFPLISEAITGTKASVGPPWFDRYTVPLALMLVLLSGIGPVIAWRRATLANLRRNMALPAAAGLLTAIVTGVAVGENPKAIAMFAFGAFVLAVLGQELWRGVGARRAMSGDSPPVALVNLVRRNRRRYGGYLIHAGVTVLFVGIAASSAFQEASDVKLSPGQSTHVGGYDLKYERTAGGLKSAANGRLEKIDLGAVMSLSRDGKKVASLYTEKSYFPSADPTLGAVSRFFEGEATSEVGLRAGLRRDVWSAISPDIGALRPRIEEGDQVFAKAADELAANPEMADAFLGEALRGLTRSYLDDPPPATFRFIVSPLVTWIWLGALIVFAGGLIALWPTPPAARRELTAAYAARLARELGRA